MKTTLKNLLADLYLEYLNNWLTVSAFAKHHEMYVKPIERLLKMGRKYHEERVQRNNKRVTQ